MKSELIEALKAIQNGADIFSRKLASELREIEKEYPQYIDICKPAGKYDGAGQLPYFGAITTPAGNKFLAKEQIKNG